MKRILFTVIPEKGHINPVIGVAKRLQAKGHEIGFYAPHDISKQLDSAGLNCFIGEFTQSQSSESNRGEIFASNVKDSDWLREWIKGLLIETVEPSMPSIQKAVDLFKPDIVVTDPMLYSAAIVSKLNGIQWVAISNSLNPVLNESIESDLLDTVRWITPFRSDLFEKYDMKLKFCGCDMLSPDLNIAFTTKEFVGEPVRNVELVGPSIPKGSRGDECNFQWDQLSDEFPIIYMSLGSQIYHQPKMFNTIFEAVKDKPVQLVATVNELMNSSELNDIPSNVLLANYTPQLQLLPKVSVMITHGGANSVMEAIHFGVPMLITPICNDQFHQAHYINVNDIGVELDLNNTTSEKCWEVLNQLLTSETIMNNMARVTRSYQQDGALNAANLVDELLAEEQPS